MNTSRKKYRRSLQVGGLIRLALLGVISAGVGGAFVVVKNRQHSLANARATMEEEIELFHKQIETLELRSMEMVDRNVLKERIAGDLAGCGFIEIESSERVIPVASGVEQYASYRRPGSDQENY